MHVRDAARRHNGHNGYEHGYKTRIQDTTDTSTNMPLSNDRNAEMVIECSMRNIETQMEVDREQWRRLRTGHAPTKHVPSQQRPSAPHGALPSLHVAPTSPQSAGSGLMTASESFLPAAPSKDATTAESGVTRSATNLNMVPLPTAGSEGNCLHSYPVYVVFGTLE
jgi:hypothetical protein